MIQTIKNWDQNLCQMCFTFNWAHCDNSSQIGFTRNKK